MSKKTSRLIRLLTVFFLIASQIAFAAKKVTEPSKILTTYGNAYQGIQITDSFENKWNLLVKLSSVTLETGKEAIEFGRLSQSLKYLFAPFFVNEEDTIIFVRNWMDHLKIMAKFSKKRPSNRELLVDLLAPIFANPSSTRQYMRFIEVVFDGIKNDALLSTISPLRSFNKFLKTCPKFTQELLLNAVENGETEVVRTLLFEWRAVSIETIKKIATKNNSDAILALINIANGLNKKLFEAIKNENTIEVLKLLHSGASVHAIDDFGATPLIYACSNFGNDEIMMMILEWEPDIAHVSNLGINAIAYAIGWDREKSVIILADLGCNYLIKDMDGIDGLTKARNRGKKPIIKILEDLEAQKEKKLKIRNLKAEESKIIKSEVDDVNIVNEVIEKQYNTISIVKPKKNHSKFKFFFLNRKVN